MAYESGCLIPRQISNLAFELVRCVSDLKYEVDSETQRMYKHIEKCDLCNQKVDAEVSRIRDNPPV